MKTKLLVCGFIALGVSHGANGEEAAPQALSQARVIVGEFSTALKSTLKPAMQQQGPVAAINVCRDVAPSIAQQFSTTTPWQVSRTSLKYRNPENAPDRWEAATLKRFAQQQAQGQSVTTLEHWQVITENGQKTLRYMKAIPTAAKPCLACHGSDIKPKIQAQLTQHYPMDKATGYQAGDIRGAFSLRRVIK